MVVKRDDDISFLHWSLSEPVGCVDRHARVDHDSTKLGGIKESMARSVCTYNADWTDVVVAWDIPLMHRAWLVLFVC